jgi:hypothetical protein
MFLPLLLNPLTLSTSLYSCQSCKTSTLLPQTLPVSADEFEYADGSLAPHACPPSRHLIVALGTIIEVACDLNLPFMWQTASPATFFHQRQHAATVPTTPLHSCCTQSAFRRKITRVSLAIFGDCSTQRPTELTQHLLIPKKWVAECGRMCSLRFPTVAGARHEPIDRMFPFRGADDVSQGLGPIA